MRSFKLLAIAAIVAALIAGPAFAQEEAIASPETSVSADSAAPASATKASKHKAKKAVKKTKKSKKAKKAAADSVTVK